MSRPKKAPTPPAVQIGQAYTKEDVVGFLRAEIKRMGSQAAFSRAWQISEAYLSDVLAGHRDPGPKILTVFKLAQRKLFVAVESGADAK